MCTNLNRRNDIDAKFVCGYKKAEIGLLYSSRLKLAVVFYDGLW